MYERFSDSIRRVMQLANQEAQRFNHEYVGTEHVLLGLVKEGSGVAANVLKNLDVDLRKIRLEVEKLVQSGPEMVTMGKLPQTPRAKKVIECSMEEARNYGCNAAGTGHLLIGILREQEGVASQVLSSLGITLDRVRSAIAAASVYGDQEPLMADGSCDAVKPVDEEGSGLDGILCGIQMSLRDHFAGLAMEGYLSGRNLNYIDTHLKETAKNCYKCADALLAARGEREVVQQERPQDGIDIANLAKWLARDVFAVGDFNPSRLCTRIAFKHSANCVVEDEVENCGLCEPALENVLHDRLAAYFGSRSAVRE